MKKWILTMLICASLNIFAQESEFLPVTDAFKFQSEISNNQLKMHWDISDGYYLYKSKISVHQDNAPVKLVFKQTATNKLDEFFGDVDIFHEKLDIQAQILGNSPIVISFQGCAEEGLCYPPVTLSLDASRKYDSDNNDVKKENANSLIWELLLFLGLGIGLAFTPCVFPMFPILSSIIVGQGNISTKTSFFYSLSYVLGMAVTYTLAGVVVGYFGAIANVQLYLQTPWVLALFSMIFVILALSMFGLFNLTLPRFIQDKLQGVSERKQSTKFAGIMLMGAISALVVSPCVSAPLAGILAYISATGDAFIGGISLLFLAFGMGIPLLVIGTGGARFLPKSGNWMNSIKNIFGVALLAVAIWLLERILVPEVTMLLWAALLIGSSVYLGAFEHAPTSFNKLTKSLGIFIFIAGVILMLAAASGQHDPLRPLNFLAYSPSSISLESSEKKPELTKKITTSIEFEATLSRAQKEQKIMVLDFYADWCIACKSLEKDVFSDPQVQLLLKDMIFIQLDITKNTEDQLTLLNKFNLFGPPAVLFFKDKHQLLGEELIGEFKKDVFVDSLQRLITEHD